MKTAEELKAEFADELRGLLLDAFVHANRKEHPRVKGPQELAEDGQFIKLQMIRAQTLLSRIVDACRPLEGVKPAQNGQHPKLMKERT